METTRADKQGGGKLLYQKPYLSSCVMQQRVQLSLSGSECVMFEKKSDSCTVTSRRTEEN